MKKRRGLADRGPSRMSRHQSIPRLERVEDRVLMATFVVTSTTDNANAVKGDGTLRGEILASNATTTANEIDFMLPSGVQTIALKSPLPNITTTLFINGSTATGFSNAPLIQITGTNPSFQTSGPAFTIAAAGSEISDLIINNFDGDGIDIDAAKTTIDGCYIGLDPTGTKAEPNTTDGILINTANNTIGGIAASDRNVISANGSNQIEINGAAAGNNTITNNFIGTNAAGTAAVFATIPGYGIAVSSSDNTIGGLTAGFGSGNLSLDLGNLISGTQAGIEFFNGSTANLVEGNFIGTDVTGTMAIPNLQFGVYVLNGVDNTIGGTIGFDSNVISGNGTASGGDGVRIQGSNATLNQVWGNYIGVASDGMSPLGNATWGVQVNGSSGNTVGDTDLIGNDLGHTNIIEHNDTAGGGGGVTVVKGVSDGILSNDIYQNGAGPGITIPGSNNGVKAPTITSVQSGAGQTRIIGSYFGARNSFYRIQFFQSITPNASGVGDGQTYLAGDDIDIRTNNTGNAVINTILSPNVPVGFYVTATATQGVLVTNDTSAFSTAVLASQAVVADLSVTTAVPTVGPELDQPYTFTFTVSNNGPNPTSDAVLTDTLPTNSTLISTTGGTVTAGVLTDDLGPLMSGSSVVVTVVVKPTATGNFVNTAMVSGPDLDPNAVNNTSTTTATVVPDADLAVFLTTGSAVAAIGSPIEFSLSIDNFGPSTATGTTAYVQFPADFTNIVVMPDQGAYTVSLTNLVTINTGILPASADSIVTIMATPTLVQQAVVTAGVTSPLADPNPNNNTASTTVTVSNAADLGVTIAANPNPVLAGQELVYTVVVTNNGPSSASAPTVTDPLPPGFSFDPTNSSAPNGTLSFANGVVTASLGALITGDSDTITIAGIPAASGLLTNTVTVGDPGLTNPVEIDPDLTNNIATVSVPVSPADLSVAVINPDDPLFINNLAVFEIQVLNSGPATATNVLLDNQVSGGAITKVSTGTFSGGFYTANLGSIAAGQTATVYLIVNPLFSGTLTDQAAALSSEYDPDPSNNSYSTSNTVSPADIAVSVSATTTPVLLGTTAVYTVTVTNNGPATATNVIFGDALPSNAYLTGLTTTQGNIAPNSSYSAITGNLGTLAAGASATVTIDMLPQSLGSSTNTASAFSDDVDPNTANNTSSAAVTVFNQAGTILFTSGLTIVGDNAGGAYLLAERIDGTAGTVTATYSTQDYTAVAGANYVAQTGTITFLPGQVYSLIIIPVLNDGKVDGDHGFLVNLSNATGGASVGAGSGTAAVIVVNTNRDTIPPIVTQLIAIPNGNQINGFLLTFDKPLDPTRAQLLSNYYVFLNNGGAVNQGTPVPLAAALYNPANDSVLLVPPAPLAGNRFYEILANGSYGTAITDTSGNLLYGSSGPNSNYVAYYGQGTSLTYDDSQNNVVTLNLTGGGIMGIYRTSNGDAGLVNLYGVVPHATKLSGSVTKLNKNGSGHTYIGAIDGLGKFGDVNSTLTTPEFYVGSAQVSASSVGAGVPVSLTVSAESVTKPAESATKPAVHHKKATPKGPHHHSKH